MILKNVFGVISILLSLYLIICNVVNIIEIIEVGKTITNESNGNIKPTLVASEIKTCLVLIFPLIIPVVFSIIHLIRKANFKIFMISVLLIVLNILLFVYSLIEIFNSIQ